MSTNHIYANIQHSFTKHNIDIITESHKELLSFMCVTSVNKTGSIQLNKGELVSDLAHF